MFQMMGVFAEFERAMIQVRVRAGLARARDEGKRLGRPPIAPALEKRIREALARLTGGSIQNDSGLPQKCRTQACTSTYAVKCSHLAPLATKGLFGKCQNRADARSRHNAFVLLAGRALGG